MRTVVNARLYNLAFSRPPSSSAKLPLPFRTHPLLPPIYLYTSWELEMLSQAASGKWPVSSSVLSQKHKEQNGNYCLGLRVEVERGGRFTIPGLALSLHIFKTIGNVSLLDVAKPKDDLRYICHFLKMLQQDLTCTSQQWWEKHRNSNIISLPSGRLEWWKMVDPNYAIVRHQWWIPSNWDDLDITKNLKHLCDMLQLN